MNNHIFVKHQGGMYNCSSCTKTFLSKRAKINHIRTVHEGIPRKKCKYEGCNFQTNDYGKYIPHLFTDHGEGEKLECLHCKQDFTNERVYDYHITNKHEPKRYQCSECGRWYKTKFNLQEHWEKYHGSVPEFMCHICGKISADQKVLDAHIKSHSQEEVSKAEILEEIGKAQKQAKQRKKHLLHQLLQLLLQKADLHSQVQLQVKLSQLFL